MTLAIDFDGVIHDPTVKAPGKRMGTPLAGSLESLTTLKNQGHTIIVYSFRARGGLTHIAQWLQYFKIPYDEITYIKPDADAYIDNKGWRFTDWPTTMAFLKDLSLTIHG
jgi:hypothetical protein